MSAICFTGHRTLEGAYLNNAALTTAWENVFHALQNFILRAYGAGYEEYYVGGALGVDMLAGLVLVRLKKHECPRIKINLILPHPNYNDRWRYDRDRVELGYIVNEAHVVTLHQGQPFALWMLQRRNEYMVNNSAITCGVWDGRVSKSGTHNCLMYAKSRGKRICCINPLHIDPATGFCEEAWNKV